MSNPPNSAAVEAMARAIYLSDEREDQWADETSYGRFIYRENAQAALTALCALHPGVGAIIEGGAVAVPRIQNRCVEADCPSFGQRVTDSCMCFREAKEATRKAVAAIGGVI